MGKEHEQWGRIGAYKLHSLYDSEKLTRNARERFLAKFEKKVDQDNSLSEQERLKRARSALKAHMLELNHKRWGKK